MQFVLLAAGRGHRLGLNITNKCFAKVGNKTLLDYSLELVLPDLFSEIIIIVGYHSEYIKNYIGTKYKGIKVTYVYQKDLLGIAHAVKIATPYIESNFMMALSDEIYGNPHIREMATFFSNEKADCVCGVVPDIPPNIQKAYTIKLDSNGNINKLVEKPSFCFNHYKGTGLCMMKPTMLNILEDLPPNPLRNEYEMGDWIQKGIDYKHICKAFRVADINFNINEPSDLYEAEMYFHNLHKGDTAI